MSDGIRVLVLDGHTTQALACVRSLGRAGFTPLVASERRWSLAGASRHCRATFRVADQTVPAFAVLRRWARAQGVRVVLPVTERSCLLCNAEAEAWLEAGMTLGCGPTDMLLEAFDKVRTIERARACGIAVPPTRVPDSLGAFRDAVADLGLPCVVKPRFSNAWDGTGFLPDPGVGYVNRLDHVTPVVLDRRQGAYWPMVQHYVRGRGTGVFALCDRGRVLRWFAHERLRDIRPSGSGSSLRRSIPLDPALRAATSRLLADLGWHGPVMLEFLDDGRQAPWLMEVNGRFWGSLQLAVAAGVDFPLQWVRLLLGERVAAIPPSYPVGVTVRWPWGDAKRLLHILRGPPRGYPDRYPPVWRGLLELLGRQPRGTRIETWARDDPRPALAEWVQGIGELLHRGDRAAPVPIPDGERVRRRLPSGPRQVPADMPRS